MKPESKKQAAAKAKKSESNNEGETAAFCNLTGLSEALNAIEQVDAGASKSVEHGESNSAYEFHDMSQALSTVAKEGKKICKGRRIIPRRKFKLDLERSIRAGIFDQLQQPYVDLGLVCALNGMLMRLHEKKKSRWDKRWEARL